MKRGFSCALQINYDGLSQKTEIDQQAKYKELVYLCPHTASSLYTLFSRDFRTDLLLNL